MSILYFMDSSSTSLNQSKKYYQTGIEYAHQSKFSKALEAFENAKVIYKALQDWTKYIYCDTEIAEVFVKQSDYPKVVKILHQSIDFAKEKGLEEMEVMGALYLKISNVYFPLGKYNQFLNVLFAAVNIFKSHSGETNPNLGLCYINLGIYYGEKRDYEKEIQYYHKALALFKNLGVDKHIYEVSSCYFSIGASLVQKGNAAEAIPYLEQALELRLSLWGEKHADILPVYLYLGFAFAELKELDKALDYFQKTIYIGEELFGKTHERIAAAHTEIGWVCFQNTSVFPLSKARYHFQEAIRMNQELLGKTTPKVAGGYYHLSLTYEADNQYDTALDSLQKAVHALYPSNGNQLDNPPENLYENTPLEYCIDSMLLFKIVHKKAEILYKKHKEGSYNIEVLQAGFQTYSWIADLITQIYDDQISEAAKLDLRKKSRVVYESIISMSLQLRLSGDTSLNYLQKAFDASEKSKANLLFTELQSTTAKLQSQIPDDLLQKESELLQEWKGLEKKVTIAKMDAATSDKQKIEVWKNQLFDLQRAYEQLGQQLEEDYPQYYQLKRRLPITDIETIQAILSEQKELCVVSYFLGNEVLYAFVINHKNFEVVEIKHSNDLEEKVKDFISAINYSFQDEYIELGHELYQLLIEPIAPLLKAAQDFSVEFPSLLILPDGILSQLPFEALLTYPIEAVNSYVDLPYLLLDFNIQYHYSASLWKYGLEQPKSKAAKTGSFVGFAPVYADTLLKDLQKKEQLAAAYHERSIRSIEIRGKTFQELLYSEKEVKGICQLFEEQGLEAVSFLHKEASIPQFRQAIPQYDYVHISAHSFPNAMEANLSGIVFSPDNHSNTPGEEALEGVFYLQDAYLLDLKADLVVLSCCETGIGQLAKGEGMLAMNRGFWAAGAKNVIYTLFKVYDEASCILTQKLFEHILAGKSYPVALRLAKLEMLQGETAMPKFWAGYVVIGV